MGSTEPGLFSEDSFDPDEVDNVVLTLYNECVDELLAISDLVDKGKLEKALRRVRRLTEMHREFYSGEEDLDERSLALLNTEVPFTAASRTCAAKRITCSSCLCPLHVMYFMWGMILYKLGKEEAAMKKFKWACRLNPFHTLPYAAMEPLLRETWR